MAAAGPLHAEDAKDPLIAKVNGVEIHQSDLDVAETEAGQIPPMPPDAKRDYLVQFMADVILVAKAAEAKHMADTADFKRRMAFDRRKLLMSEHAAVGRQGGAHRRGHAQGLSRTRSSSSASRRRCTPATS